MTIATGPEYPQRKHQDRRSDQKKVQSVYFGLTTFPDHPAEGPRIKVGETSDLDKRKREHSKAVSGISRCFEYLCAIRGTRADEQAVLKHFDRCRLKNEVETFWPEDELVEYIRWLRDQHFVWVPDCDQAEGIENLEVVEASLWMPGQDRRKPKPSQETLFTDYGPLCLPPRVVTMDDFYTNTVIVEAARLTMGGIDLDPASHAIANSVVKASRFYTVHDNGLKREWAGRVWLNPPFSQWSSWVPKVVNEWKSGRIESMCVLCATRTLTAQYFGAIHGGCSAICILHGRIPFWGGRAGSSPDDGHAIFYFGRQPEKFRSAFLELGQVYLPATAN